MKIWALIAWSTSVFLSSASGQFTVSPKSVVLKQNESSPFQCTRPITDANATGDPVCTTVDIRVTGVPASQVSFQFEYTPGEPGGWINFAVVADDTLRIRVTENSPARGKYSARIHFTAGSAVRSVSVALIVSPQDNQFNLFNSQGQIVAQAIALNSGKQSDTFQLQFNELGGSTATSMGGIRKLFQATFEPANASDGQWLTLSSQYDYTPLANFSVRVNAASLPPSPLPYTGFVHFAAVGSSNITTSYPVEFTQTGLPAGPVLEPGAPQTFGYGAIQFYNGPGGFLLNVPDNTGRITLTAQTDEGQVRIYARAGSEVTKDQFDNRSDPGQPLRIESPLRGRWYVGLEAVSSYVTGVIGVEYSQRSSCNYAVSPTAADGAKDGGGGSFQLTTGDSCLWSAISSDNWLQVTSGTGPGSGKVSYSYAANTGAARKARITMESAVFELSQAAAAPVPIITTFTATPETISYGKSSTLEWAVSAAISVTIDQGLGDQASSGRINVTPGRPTTYTLTAKNDTGPAQRTVTVTVIERPPSLTGFLTVGPNPILLQGTATAGAATVSWQAPSGVTRVEVRANKPDGLLLGSGAGSGQFTAAALTDGTTLFLQNTTDAGALTVANTLDSVTVRAVAANQLHFAASPISAAPDSALGAVLVTWRTPGNEVPVIRVQSATGPQVTGELPSSGSLRLGEWVSEGLQFFLQDGRGGDSSGDARTLAKLVTTFQPAPAVATVSAVQFSANPNPILLSAPNLLGKTTLSWKAPGYSKVQVRVDSPDGAAMTGVLGPEDSTITGEWVHDGLKFFLQDASGDTSAGADKTIAAVEIKVMSQ